MVIKIQSKLLFIIGFIRRNKLTLSKAVEENRVKTSFPKSWKKVSEKNDIFYSHACHSPVKKPAGS